jgi:succinate dehydrogenase/fumarate reductase flavoprotein subunit
MLNLDASNASSPATVIRADVLVLGGGPAGCAAAIAAAERGARVVLADKGHVGTSGAAASAGVGVWYIDDEPAARAKAMGSREDMGGRLASRPWMERVLDETRTQVDRLAEWGHPFPQHADGTQARTTLQGPEFMRRMRRQVVRARVKILDHAPALELLRADDGALAGAAGVFGQRGGTWRVEAPAVVIATGGCGFLAGGLGCNVLTGDGHLLAAELGAELSGMEFSNAYAISPAFSPVTKTAIYSRARFTYADGTTLEGAGSQKGRSVIAKTLLDQPVHAILDGWNASEQEALRRSQPNFFLSFDRFGIDPFTQRFPITLRLEGTIRGTGGLRVIDETCATTVPGLYAAGDAATRELICGGFTGGGSHNSAWALSSGTWAGRGAAEHAGRIREEVRAGASAEGAGRAGLRPTEARSELTAADVTAAVQAEVHPYDRNYFRTGDGLAASSGRLESLWSQVTAGLGAPQTAGSGPAAAQRAREAAAMVAHARWMYAAASERNETRGMHRRVDAPKSDPAQQRRLLVGGLAQVWTKPDPVRPIHSTDPLPEGFVRTPTARRDRQPELVA